MSNRTYMERAAQHMLGNYRPAPLVFVEGKGCRLVDADGRSYLDLCAGIAVVSVGHGHPKLAAAIAEQASKLMHVSNLFFNAQAVELADALAKRTPYQRFFFCNSGAEANEALLKLARRSHYERGQKQRTKLVSALSSFHGRTMGALSLTGQPKYHEGLGPLVGDVQHVPYADLAALEAAVDERTAAVLLEPVQGEGGIVVGSPEYLRGVRALCDARGALLFFDEVQTGYGRTGRFLGSEWSGVQPDGCSLAKGIGGGFPLGAIAVTEALVDGLPPGSHATTFGGNPLACAAALAVLQIFDEEDLVGNCVRVGEHLGLRLKQLADDVAVPVSDARGIGLLRGVKLNDAVDPATALSRLREAGVLASLAGGNVLRVSPPLCVTKAEIDEGIDAMRSVLVGLAGGKP